VGIIYKEKTAVEWFVGLQNIPEADSGQVLRCPRVSSWLFSLCLLYAEYSFHLEL